MRSSRGVAQRVLHHVDQGLGQELGVSIDNDASGRLGRQGPPPLLGGRAERLRHRAGQGRQVHGAETRPPGPGLYLGDPKERGEGVQSGVQVGERRLDRGRLGLGAAHTEARLQPLPQPGERRAQVVGDVVGDLAKAVHQGRDAVEHPVECRAQGVQVVACAAQGYAAAQVAVDDRLGCAGHLREPALHLAAQGEAAGHAQHQHAQEGEAEGAEQDAVEHGDALQGLPDDQPAPARHGHGQGAERLRTAGDAQGRPSRLGHAREPPGQQTPVRAPKAVVEGARCAVALLDRIQHSVHAFGLVLLGQGQGLGLDAGVELMLQRRACGQQRHGAQDDDRQAENGGVERRQPKAVGADHSHSGSLTQ